jgi:hypothetical protein
LVYCHDHAAVTQPLGDTDTRFGSNIASHSAPGRQKPTGGVVAILGREIGET